MSRRLHVASTIKWLFLDLLSCLKFFGLSTIQLMVIIRLHGVYGAIRNFNLFVLSRSKWHTAIYLIIWEAYFSPYFAFFLFELWFIFIFIFFIFLIVMVRIMEKEIMHSWLLGLIQLYRQVDKQFGLDLLSLLLFDIISIFRMNLCKNIKQLGLFSSCLW